MFSPCCTRRKKEKQQFTCATASIPCPVQKKNNEPVQKQKKKNCLIPEQKQNNQPVEKTINQEEKLTVSPLGAVALGGKKKNNNLPVQCPPHAFHILRKKIKNNQPALKTKEKMASPRHCIPCCSN